MQMLRSLFLTAVLPLQLFAQSARTADTVFAEVRTNPEKLRTFLRAMPKGAELHTHLSGTPGPDRLLSLAASSRELNYFVSIPDRDSAPDDPDAYALAAFPPGGKEPAAKPGFRYVSALALGNAASADLKSRLNAFRQAHLINKLDSKPLLSFYSSIFQRRGAVVNSREMIPFLLRDLMAQARKDRVSCVEVQINPFPSSPGAAGAENERSMNLTNAREFVTLLARVVSEENARVPESEQVDVRFVLAFLRTSARTLTALPIAFELASGNDAAARSIAGINLVGNEYSQEQKSGQFLTGPEHLRDYLLTLRRAYPRVRLAMHAGESTVWDWHVRDTLLSGAERIGHGTNLELSPDGADLELVRRSRSAVEACPTSNQLLLGVPFSRHPLLKYLRSGIPVSVSTDDAGVFETNMTEEFARLAESMPLSFEEIKLLARNSLVYSFAEPDRKRELLSRFDEDMKHFEQGN